jgi:hypothetical protein
VFVEGLTVVVVTFLGVLPVGQVPSAFFATGPLLPTQTLVGAGPLLPKAKTKEEGTSKVLRILTVYK